MARGRKSKGEFTGKSATITTRVRPDTRAALEAAKRASGRSLSNEVEFRLRASLQKSTQAQRRNQALAAAITLVAEAIERGTGLSWLYDQFTGVALQHAIGNVGLHFAATPAQGTAPAIPPAITAAKMLPEFAKSPEGFGTLIAYQLITEIVQAASPPKVPNEWDMPIFFTAREAVLGDIGRDLGLTPKKEPRR